MVANNGLPLHVRYSGHCFKVREVAIGDWEAYHGWGRLRGVPGLGRTIEEAIVNLMRQPARPRGGWWWE